MTIRVLMKISENAYPELYAELSEISPRKRGERLRLLATMQLKVPAVSGDGEAMRPPTKKKRKSAKHAEKKHPEGSEGETLSSKEESPKEDEHASLRSSMLSGMKNQF